MHSESKSSVHSLRTLVELSHELHDYIMRIPHSTEALRSLAREVLEEIQRLMQYKQERYIYFLFEASIIPKLDRLTQAVHFYQYIGGEKQARPSPYTSSSAKSLQNTYCAAYEPFTAKAHIGVRYQTLPKEEKDQIDQAFEEIYERLSNATPILKEL